jgi:hypothetical protein
MSFDSILARSPSIIYQPGGVASGLVVTTWAAIQKYIAARQGACTVYVDDSIVSPALVPGASGVTNGFGRLEIRPYREDFANYSTLIVQDGATLKGIWRLAGTISVEGDAQGATPSFDWDYTPNVIGLSVAPTFFVSEFASIGTTTTATHPCIVVPAALELVAQFEENGGVFVQQLIAPLVHTAAVSSVFRAYMFGAEILSGPAIAPVTASWIDGPGTSFLLYDSPTPDLSGGNGVWPGNVPPSNAATKFTDNMDAAPGDVRSVDFPIALVTVSSATLLPINAIVLRALVEVDTPYSPAATIAVGQAGTPALLETTADNDPQVAGLYDAPQRTPWGGVARAVLVTIAGAPAAGSGHVTVEYSLPTA